MTKGPTMTEWELRHIMREHQLSKADLADILACSSNQAERYIKGWSVLKGPRLVLLKRHLGSAYIDPYKQ